MWLGWAGVWSASGIKFVVSIDYNRGAVGGRQSDEVRSCSINHFTQLLLIHVVDSVGRTGRHRLFYRT